MRHNSESESDIAMPPFVRVQRAAGAATAARREHAVKASDPANFAQNQTHGPASVGGQSHGQVKTFLQRRGVRIGHFAVALGFLAAGAGASALEKPEDKRRYSLYALTPDRLLRDLTTDRPDTTESPFTVDAGRIQIETNIFGFSRSRPDADGTRTDTYKLGTTNIRIGLTNSTELNVVWQPYGNVKTRQNDSMAIFRSAGIGGLDIRGKVNLWGNDTFEKPGSTALALLPFITLPTDRRNGISPEFVEGGLIVPYAIKLSEKFGLGLNAGVLRTKPDAEAGYHTDYLTSASLAYDWSERVGTYYEIAGRFHTKDPRGDVVNLGTGITFKLDKNTQLDAGINIGVTSAADRINPFFGLAKRF